MQKQNASLPPVDDLPEFLESHRAGPVSPLRWAFRLVVGVVVAASFAVWIYAYSGLAERDAPDLLGDRALAQSAENICAAAMAELSAMPNALDAADGPERAGQIRQTTTGLQAMVTDLEALNLSDDRDQRIFSGWLNDWRVMLGDRLDYADAIEVDDQAQFLVSDLGVRERLDKRLTRFANTNLMTSCAAPTDVG